MRAVDVVALLHLVRAQEADHHPGRDAQAPAHHGHRRGELLAVADPAVGAQEVEQVVGAVARSPLGERVAEAAVLAEPVLEPDRLLEAARRAGGHLAGQARHPVGQVVRQVGVGREDVLGRGAGAREGARQRLHLERREVVLQPDGALSLGGADEVEGVGVVAPVAAGLDRGHRVRRRQPLRVEGVAGPDLEGHLPPRHPRAQAGRPGEPALGALLRGDLAVRGLPGLAVERVEHRDPQVRRSPVTV